jgi:hypothetical protein
MRAIIITVLITAAALTAAPTQAKGKTSTKTSTRAAAAKQTPPKALTIPAGAVEIEPGLWKHTDAAGKLWHYRRTPFSVVRFEPEPEMQPVPESNLKAVEQGDNVRFEKRTPFGVTTWTKKKSELNEEERQAFQAAGGKE